MFRFVAACLMLFSACNSARDEEDMATLKVVEALVAEREELAKHRGERKTEQDSLRTARAAFTPVSTGELLTLAGADAKLERDEAKSFYRIVSVRGAGTPSDALRFVRAVLAKSRMLNVTELQLAKDGWVATFALIELEAPVVKKPAAAFVFAPAADESMCFTACSERRERIKLLSAKLVAFDAELGELIAFTREKKEFEELARIDSKFISRTNVGPLLDGLETAAWLPGDASLSFALDRLSISAPATLTEGCAATFPGCQYSAPGKRLELALTGR